MQQLSFLPGEMTPGERSLIQRALKTLDRHLHEPGVAFTSTRAAREWLILNMAGLEREEFRVLYPQQLWLRLSGCLSDARNEKLTLQNSLLLRPGVFTTPLFHFYICISGKSSV